jgi:hypothetical protein
MPRVANKMATRGVAQPPLASRFSFLFFLKKENKYFYLFFNIFFLLRWTVALMCKANRFRQNGGRKIDLGSKT